MQNLLRELADLKPQSSPIKPHKKPTRPDASTAATSCQTDCTPPKPEEAERPLQQPWRTGTPSSVDTSEIQPAEDQPDSHKVQARYSTGASSQQHREDGSGAHGPGWFQNGHDWVMAATGQLASKANALWRDEVSREDALLGRPHC